MERLRLLWIRVLRDSERATPRAIAEEFFQVEVCEDIHAVDECMKRFAPHTVCWEYEEADAVALRAMRDFKLANPALPILMLTGQHSESLAVWAFRARVWNYLIKPVAKSELRANFTMLAELLRQERGPARAVRQLRGLLPGEYAGNGAANDSSVLRAAIVSVERHYAEKLRQSAVAGECGMSSSAFSRAFKAEYGLTFSEYLMRFRIGQACYLLRLGSHSATSAGVAVGFDDASHFARAFRKVMGMSPSSYKRQKAAMQGAERRQRRRAALRGALMRHRDPRGPSEVASAVRDQEKSSPRPAARVR